ncbi:MAG: leucine-rich repeat domain-containing protein [Bacteroidetes bacterium]|nr:leucine-rich repeat domain-containing protein [Bacteroidota bacterium]
MKRIAAVLLLFVLGLKISTAQIASGKDQLYNKLYQQEELTVDMTNPEYVGLVLDKIHEFKNLRSIEFEGEANENTLKKVFYRLSVLKNLANITLRDNELKKMPDNVKNIKTLTSLTIEGNNNLDFDDMFDKLSEINLVGLKLIDNDFKNDPKGISEISSLRSLTLSGSSRLNYEKLIDNLSKLPALDSLSLPINFITQLPQNIFRLKSLKQLDVSNNVLSELPEGVSSLKAINNLSINGNIIVNQFRELEKFRDADIKYLSIDKEISGDEIEQIKRMFPKAEINYPVYEEDDDSQMTAIVPATDRIVPKKTEEKAGNLVVKKDFSILSAAYLNYPDIFRSVHYNFDTLLFNERYADASYINTTKRVRSNYAGGRFSLYKMKGRRKEVAFNIGSRYSRAIDFNELTAFNGMHWVYNGELTKKQFLKKYIKKKEWNDVRISFDNNNSQFSIELKNDKGFEKISAYPIYNKGTLEKSREAYNRRFSNYQKALVRRAKRFEKNLLKDKKRYDNDYILVKQKAWDELLLQMSNEERVMTEKQWLEYYDNIITNEKLALNNSSLQLEYFERGMKIRGYNSTILRNNNSKKSQITYGKLISVSVEFIDENGGGKLAVKNVITIDKMGNRYYQSEGGLGLSPNNIIFWQNANNVIIVELRNGTLGIVSTSEINSKKIPVKSELLELKTKVLDKNLDTMADIFKTIGLE